MAQTRLPLKAIIALCRTLHVGLDAGLSPVKLFKQQAKSGPKEARDLCEAMAARLKAGDSFAAALAPHQHRFPQLFVQLTSVGEATGNQPRAYEELALYYENQLSARRQFLQAITWPALSYVAAVMVVALMVLILGLLGGAFDPTGIGLLGPTGAIIVLGVGYGIAAVVVGLYITLRDHDGFKSWFEAKALALPGLSAAYRCFAVQRFAMALGMAHEAGLRADESVRIGMQSTSNAKFQAKKEEVAAQLRSGTTIAKVMTRQTKDLFPEPFLDALQVAETSGQITEVMERQAEQYREDGLRHTKTLARIAGGVVYGCVALLIILVIVRIVMSIAGVYQEALDQI